MFRSILASYPSVALNTRRIPCHPLPLYNPPPCIYIPVKFAASKDSLEPSEIEPLYLNQLLFIPMSSPSSKLLLGELMAIASPQGKGLHPAAKFSQSDNSYTVNIDNIKILSVDIYNGTIGESTGIFVIKTYPASPAYMFQEAIGMYPIVRFWRPKVDGTWRGWREV